MRPQQQGKPEDLFRKMGQFRGKLEIFERAARDFLGSLDGVPEAEVEAMVTPRANILGTLECLLADDLEPTLRKLGELDGLLKEEFALGGAA